MRPRGVAFGRFAALALAGAAAFVACGGTTTTGSGGGTGSLSGTVANTTFSVASQIGAIQPYVSTCSGSAGPGAGDGGETCTSSGQVVIVLLTNRADASCAAAQSEEATGADIEFANLDDLELAVGSAAATVTPGTYPIAGSDAGTTAATVAGAQFGTTDASCNAAVQAQASSGTVTITQLSSTSVSGTYDVTFGTQGSFSGSFDVDLCVLPDGGGAGGDGGPPTCK